MNLRCRKGDKALVVSGGPHNNGKLVTCLELLPPMVQADGPLWRVDRLIEWDSNGLTLNADVVPDKALMPIRPDDSAVDATPAMLDNGHG